MKKKVTNPKTTNSQQNPNINRKLIENFISLQKVMVNLSAKFDNLSDQIAKLLELFEISAKAMAEKDYEQFSKSDNKEVLEKLENLLEQNKIIAKGLTMLHEKENFEEEKFNPIQQNQQQITQNRQMPSRRILPSEHSRLQRRPSQSYY